MGRVALVTGSSRGMGACEAEEFGKLVAFLASDDAEFIDGQIIKVDGGYKLM